MHEKKRSIQIENARVWLATLFCRVDQTSSFLFVADVKTHRVLPTTQTQHLIRQAIFSQIGPRRRVDCLAP